MADVKATAERIEKKIDAQIEKYNAAKRTTIIVYVVLMLVMVGYFSWLTGLVRDFSTPDSLADIAADGLERQLPVMRKQLVAAADQQASEYLNAAIDEGIRRIPEVRHEVEETVLREVRAKLVETNATLNEFVDYAYANHAEQIRPLIKELDAATTSEEIENILFELLKQPFDHQELRIELETYGLALAALAERLHALRTATDLDEIHRMEKEIIAVLKEISERSG